MRYLDDVAGAGTQIREASKLDPTASDIDIEMARVDLYLKNFADAKRHLDALAKRADLPIWKQRKMRDLVLQLYQRWSEHLLQQHDEAACAKTLELLKDAYVSCPAVLADGRMKEKLVKAHGILKTCSRKTSSGELKTRLARLEEWWARVVGIDSTDANRTGTGRRCVGRIVRLRREQGFGFIKRDDGNEFFFHMSAFTDPGMWEGAKEDDWVAFDTGIRNGREAALDVSRVT